MKKVLLLGFMMLLSVVCKAQSIARIVPYEGGKVYATTPENLFSDCQIRMCRYATADNS